jgi:hypothetical protein
MSHRAQDTLARIRHHASQIEPDRAGLAYMGLWLLAA